MFGFLGDWGFIGADRLIPLISATVNGLLSAAAQQTSGGLLEAHPEPVLPGAMCYSPVLLQPRRSLGASIMVCVCLAAPAAAVHLKRFWCGILEVVGSLEGEWRSWRHKHFWGHGTYGMHSIGRCEAGAISPMAIAQQHQGTPLKDAQPSPKVGPARPLRHYQE